LLRQFFVEWCLSPGQVPPSAENLLEGTPVLAERMVLHGGLPLKQVRPRCHSSLPDEHQRVG
jgi:hypothetical protein